MDDAFEHAIRLVEAFVFASAEPVASGALERLVPMPYSAYEVLAALRERCQGRGVHLVEVGGGWQFRTALDLAPELATVLQKPRRLPRAAMETLAIVAQYQPVTRTEIEDIRGAALSQATIDLLLEAGLIAPRGTKNVPGGPTLWVRSRRFWRILGWARSGTCRAAAGWSCRSGPTPAEGDSGAIAGRRAARGRTNAV